jgi:segregation and condensation protein B
MNTLQQHIEVLIFASEKGITKDELISCLKSLMGWELTYDEVENAVSDLKERFASETFSFELCEIAGGYQFLSKKEYHPVIQALLQYRAQKKLSSAALETLSIIAYRQPVIKSEIEHIRGVNCDYSIQKLLEKELITIAGKSDLPGKPVLYATSESFMNYFGLNSVKDLPQLKDIVAHTESSIGESPDG